MSLSDHIRLSVRLELARFAIMSGLEDILQYHVPKNSWEYRKTNRVIEDIQQLQSKLDDRVCNEEPDGIGDACTKVYYGPSSSFGHNDEFENVLDNYAVRHAMYLLEGRGRQMDTNEIVLTRFDSSFADIIREKEHEEKYLHIKADTWYVTKANGIVNERPPEDEISPNQSMYALTPSQIRDFCEDAMRCGKYPTDGQIESAVWMCRIT